MNMHIKRVDCFCNSINQSFAVDAVEFALLRHNN